MLTDTAIRKAKSAEKDYKLSDSAGLYLFVTRSGSKVWRMKYRFAGKEKRLIFGPYPDVSLTEARDMRDAAKRLLRDNVDPGIEKKKARLAAVAAAGETFETVARSWFEMNKGRWSPVHAYDVLNSLERDVFPDIGALPIGQVTSPEVLSCLRKVEKRGSIETARRLRQRISGVFAYGISEGKAATDPAAVVAKALKPLPKRGRQPAIIDLEQARQVLLDAEAAGASPVTKLASRFLAITAQRPGVIRGAVWDEFEGIDWQGEPEDQVEALWRIPPARMKLLLDRKDEEAFEHVVPLPPQAVAVLQAVRRLTGRGKLAFPNQRHAHRPLSENAIGYLYNRVGYHGRHVPHGWRSSFSTIMNERAKLEGTDSDRKVIDMMLAHVPENRVEGAYNRAAYMPRRVEIAAAWAELITEGLKPAHALLAMPRR